MIEYEEKNALCSAIKEEIFDAEESIATETCRKGGRGETVDTVKEGVRALNPEVRFSPATVKRYIKKERKWEKWKRGETVTLSFNGRSLAIKGKGQTYEKGKYTCDLGKISFRELQEKKERLGTLKTLYELLEC